MQVKVFSTLADAPKLEADINTWLKNNNNIEISHVKQSYAYYTEHTSHILVSIWYTVRSEDTSPM
jgi:hypothetical protein